MYMSVRRSILIVAAFVFAALLSVYLFVQELWNHAVRDPGRLAAADRCEPDASGAEQTQRVNPNKMLFISCGGFLD